MDFVSEQIKSDELFRRRPFIAKTWAMRNKKNIEKLIIAICVLCTHAESLFKKSEKFAKSKKNFLRKVLPRFKQLQTWKLFPHRAPARPSTAQTGRHCKSDLWMVFPSVRIFYSPAPNAREQCWGRWQRRDCDPKRKWEKFESRETHLPKTKTFPTIIP